MTYIVQHSKSAISDCSSGQLYISQQPLADLIQGLKGYPYRGRFFIYELRVLTGNSSYNPSGCAQLAHVATIEPEDAAEYYRVILGVELKQLPAEQRKLEIEKVLALMQDLTTETLEPALAEEDVVKEE